MSADPRAPQPAEIPEGRKLQILNQHRIGADEPEWRSLNDTRWCLHCAKVFTGHAVRVYRDDRFTGGYFLRCGTPECDGSPLDWSLPDSDFARGITEQTAQAELIQMCDKPLPAKEPALPPPDPNYEDCGTYGPELSIVPRYRNKAQRQRLRSLLWREPASGGDEASGHPDFLHALREAAKAGMRIAYAAYLGEDLLEDSELAFPARASATVGDYENPDDRFAEGFQVEIEYGDYSEAGVAPLVPSIEAFDELLYRVANEQKVQEILLRQIRLGIKDYLTKLDAGKENLKWRVEVVGFGG